MTNMGEADRKHNVQKIGEIEKEQRENRSVGQRISEWIAKFCGSMTFVYVHIVWFGLWIIGNSVAGFTIDPFPYTFLTLVVSLEAIFLSTFILISQNHDAQVTDRRNSLDLQINLLAEQENTKMLELLQRIAMKVGVDCDDDEIRELMKPVEPGQLVSQIMDHIEGPQNIR